MDWLRYVGCRAGSPRGRKSGVIGILSYSNFKKTMLSQWVIFYRICLRWLYELLCMDCVSCDVHRRLFKAMEDDMTVNFGRPNF